LDNLSQQFGFSIDDACCQFPSDRDPDDPMFDGVQFSIFEEVATISLTETRQYMVRVAEEFVRLHPNKRDELAPIMARLSGPEWEPHA
jgi:hypothetical protein